MTIIFTSLYNNIIYFKKTGKFTNNYIKSVYFNHPQMLCVNTSTKHGYNNRIYYVLIHNICGWLKYTYFM